MPTSGLVDVKRRKAENNEREKERCINLCLLLSSFSALRRVETLETASVKQKTIRMKETHLSFSLMIFCFVLSVFASIGLYLKGM